MNQPEASPLAGIRGHHLFAGLAPAQLQRLMASAHIEDAEAGKLLFAGNPPGTSTSCSRAR